MPSTPRDHKVMAALPGLRGVLDNADTLGGKNALIDTIHRRALREAIAVSGPPRYATVIDLGCGIGRMSSFLLGFGDCVLGIDPDESMLRRARGARHDHRISFLSSIDELPVLTQPVLVVSTYVLQLLERWVLEDALTALADRIGAGGVFVGLDRVVRPDDGTPVDIEPRSIEWYGEALQETGWRLDGHRYVRRADSPVQRLNIRAARLRRGPLPPWAASRLAALELTAAASSNGSSYTDAVFWSHRDAPPTELAAASEAAR